MEQTTRQIDSIKIGNYLKNMRNARRYEPEIIDLVEEDLNLGLTEEQTNLYLKKGFKLAQMKVLSGFLRKGIDEEFVKQLTSHENLTGYQMQVALDFYEKGVPVPVIEETVSNNATPSAMREIFQKILANTENVKKESESVSEEMKEYVKELVTQIEDVVGKIQYQEQRYDELNKKLTIFESTRTGEEVAENLAKKLEDTEAALSSQQDRINSASSTIARLREQADQKEKEMNRMQTRIDTLEQRLLDKADAMAALPKAGQDAEAIESAVTAQDMRSKAGQAPEEDVKQPGGWYTGQPAGKPIESSAGLKLVDTQPVISENTPADDPFAKSMYGIPVYYQMPVVDAQGRVVQHLPVERTRRPSEGGIAAMIARLCFKKKSRQDIVKLVASGDLVPAQLIQIKSGIEKGLIEGQLVELINNNVSAEKMKEIIEIAVLENSMN